jgi:hypothetical protein
MVDEIRTIPPTLTKTEWNALLAHALMKGPKYIVDYNESEYEAVNGLSGVVSYHNASFATLMAAVIAASPASGETIELRDGTFPGNVVLNHDFINLEGAGVHSTTIQGSITFDPNNVRCSVSKLKLDGQASVAKGIIMEKSTVSVPIHIVDKVHIYNFTSRGLSLVKMEDNILNDITVETCPTGIYYEDTWGTNIFKNPRIYNHTAYGLYLKSCWAQIQGGVLAAGAATAARGIGLEGGQGEIKNIWIEQPNSDNPCIEMNSTSGHLKVSGTNLLWKGGTDKPGLIMYGEANSFGNILFDPGIATNYGMLAAGGYGKLKNCRVGANCARLWKSTGGHLEYEGYQRGPTKLSKWITFFESIDGWLQQHSGGSATLSTDGYLDVKTGAVSGNYARIRKICSVTDLMGNWTNRASVEIFVTLMANTLQTLYFGTGWAEDNSFLGFKVVNNTLYGCVRNGASETLLSLGTFSAGAEKKLRAELTPGVNVTFWSGDVYQGQITTNLPASGGLGNLAYVYFVTNESVEKEIKFYYWNTQQYGTSFI